MPGRHHALLIGIDAYAGPNPRPLSGCVHDIDDVQRLLLTALGLEARLITRLIAPLPGATPDDAVPSKPATRANILAALDLLASDAVTRDDRVLIYYSGHGTRIEVRSGASAITREALVPIDVNMGPAGELQGLLYDFELNPRLGAIASRTTQVSVIIDACHAGGVVRSGRRGVARSAECHGKFTAEILGLPVEAGTTSTGMARALTGSLDTCAVACACLANERAEEGIQPDGRPGGYFTRALLRAIGGAGGDPAELRWGSIWHALVAELARRSQHPQLLASFARKVFGGPPERGEPGIPLRRQGKFFSLAAGELAGLTIDSIVGVYGPEPLLLPLDRGSPEDVAARLGELRVSAASPSQAEATPVAGSDPKQLAKGVRARVLRPGRPLLTLAVTPANPLLERVLTDSGFVRLVDLDEGPAVTLQRIAEGRWAIADELHSADEASDAPPLVVVPADAAPSTLARLLLQYCRYIAPVELARRCQGQAGAALSLELLDCTRESLDAQGRLVRADLDLQDPKLGSLAAGQAGLVEQIAGRSRYCIRIRNLLASQLYVTSFECTAEGRVHVLGASLPISGKSHHVLWRDAALGVPFAAALPPGRRVGFTRLVVIGTTAADKPLHFLATPMSFAEVLAQAPNKRRGGASSKGTHGVLVDEWASAQLALAARAPG